MVLKMGPPAASIKFVVMAVGNEIFHIALWKI
jgi:hypothetical protein